ncbi:MAG: trimethylamine methyltransferase family protein, partial [Eubacterium sp.]
SMTKKHFEYNGNLHEEAKALLEKKGILLENVTLAEWFKKRGFRVEDNRVKFKDWEIEHVLKLCPAEVKLNSGQKEFVIGNATTFYGFSGDPSSVIINGKKNNFLREDGISIFKLMDTSRSIGFLSEFPWFSKYRSTTEQLAFLFKHSNKPLVILPAEKKGFRQYQEVFQLINNFYEKKKTTHVIVPMKISDEGILTWEQLELIENTAGFHQALLLKIYGSAGEDELLTEESLCVRLNAVLLGYCCIIQLLHSKLPVLFGLSNKIHDAKQKEMILGSVSGSMLKTLSELWRYYQIPFMMENLPMDALLPDILAGAESMSKYREMFGQYKSSIMNCTLGSLKDGKSISMEKFLIDEEMIEMLIRLYRGIDCSEEMSCYDAVKNTGPRGSYFNTRMLKVIKKEFYDSRYLNKESVGNWRSEPIQDLIGHVETV